MLQKLRRQDEAGGKKWIPDDDLVEKPTRFELVFNLKTTKDLALTIPPIVLMRATRVVR